MPVPKGYVLDTPQQQPGPKVPAGYTLDGPAQPPAIADVKPFASTGLDTSNPNSEGTYKMVGGDGSTASVPFSKVRGAQNQGFAVTDGAESVRYAKDAAALPTTAAKVFGKNPVSDTVGSVATHAKNLVAAPFHAFIDSPTAEEIPYTNGGGMVDPRVALGISRMFIKPTVDALQKSAKLYGDGGPQASLWSPSSYDAQGNNVPTAGSKIIDALPLYGPWSRGYADEVHQKGFVPATAGLATDAFGPKAMEGIARLPGFAKTALVGDVTKPMTPGGPSPLDRYNTAKGMGVNLNAADATNSPLLRGVTDVNERTLRGAPVHQAARAANMDALDTHTGKFLDNLSSVDPETAGTQISSKLREPFTEMQNRADDMLHNFDPNPREVGGAKMQGDLQARMDQLHEQTTQGYQDFARDYGSHSVDPGLVNGTAEAILHKNGRFSEQFPSLVSRKATQTISDAAKLGNEAQQSSLGSPSVSDLIRSRSALLDLTRDPEIVKSAYGGDLQQLIAAHDQTIMNSLPEEGQGTWRDLNAKWGEMKNTFDNPSSPFYHALRTPNPTTLTEGIGAQTPEAVRAMKDNLGGDAGIAPVRRGVAEKVLGKTGTGEYDLSNLAGRVERLPEDYRQGLFGNKGQEDLRGLANDYEAQRPFVKPAYTTDPEKLVQGFGPQTAAGVRQMRDIPRLPGFEGPAAPRVGAPGVGAIQRGATEKLLGATNEGGFNYPRLAGRIERLNEGYRGELFGTKEQPLRDIGQVGRLLTENANKSGTGGINVKSGELKGLMNITDPKSLFSNVVGSGLQRQVANVLTKPASVDWMMKPYVPGVKTATVGAAAKLLPFVPRPKPAPARLDLSNVKRLKGF